MEALIAARTTNIVGSSLSWQLPLTYLTPQKKSVKYAKQIDMYLF
jgi:hypothetical protein